MIKKSLALVAACSIAVSGAFAGGKACCASNAKTASNENQMQCISFANLNITADQKSKLETWQNECVQAGCTKESHAKFLRQAKGVLSKEQYAALKKECGSGHTTTRS